MESPILVREINVNVFRHVKSINKTYCTYDNC